MKQERAGPDLVQPLQIRQAKEKDVSMPSKSGSPLLSIQQLSYTYPSGQVALREINLSLGLRERVGIVGPNGAGKTTLLLHLNGLLPEHRAVSESVSGTTGFLRGFRRQPTLTRPAEQTVQPDPSGSVISSSSVISSGPSGDRGTVTAASNPAAVELLGMPVVAPNLTEIRRLVGLLFQDPDDQLFCSTVLDDVAFGPLQLGFDRDEIVRRVRLALRQVGLSEFDQRAPGELSVGERRRVCLAGVLACEPVLLALDEPSSNLDPRSRRELIQLLRNCDAAQVIASHDLDLVLDLCDRVVILDRGEIQADGPTRELLSQAALMEAHGLEVPWRLR